jgi:hypothetical protein
MRRLTNMRRTQLQLRADIISATILGFGAVVTLCWDIAVARLVLHFLDVL